MGPRADLKVERTGLGSGVTALAWECHKQLPGFWLWEMKEVPFTKMGQTLEARGSGRSRIHFFSYPVDR